MKIYLDLLPQEKKNELRRSKIFRRILHEEMLFLVPLVIFIALLLNIYYLLNFQYNSSVTLSSVNKSQDKYQELNNYEEKFKKVNASIDILSKIQSSHLHWLNVLDELGSVVPEGVYISDFSTKNYQIFLLGKARSRDNLLALKNNLDNSDCFKDVNVPLSNLVVKDNVDFQMDFVVIKDCLKK
ncbi:MAG: Fimbrial assembly family protein [Candidatus Moranbacteria bacterium GW2011_GWC2_37_8]|nr:MAG: Fimbrial assembly family protein [Candidatus Moranbacteria bacterium GW2011_GWC2_37_8]KKQ63055.1 MAG: Fimbrial assembly family protein [Parcubacteria group bacterium GW2011_GWC1_38_22]